MLRRPEFLTKTIIAPAGGTANADEPNCEFPMAKFEWHDVPTPRIGAATDAIVRPLHCGDFRNWPRATGFIWFIFSTGNRLKRTATMLNEVAP